MDSELTIAVQGRDLGSTRHSTKENIRNRILESKGIENKRKSFSSKSLYLSLCAILLSFLTKDVVEIEGTEKGWAVLRKSETV